MALTKPACSVNVFFAYSGYRMGYYPASFRNLPSDMTFPSAIAWRSKIAL
jgi:hypothetical protein